MTTTHHAVDSTAVYQLLTTLFPRREAARLFRECGGSAARAIELAEARGGAGASRLRAAQALHEQALLEKAAKGPVLGSPNAVRDYLVRTLSTRPYEVFMVLYVNTRHELVGSQELFRGTIDGASVHPREVVREALAHHAAAIIAAHNHPSSVGEPSAADELITTRLREALSLVEIRLLDHLLVAGRTCVSFAERGLI